MMKRFSSTFVHMFYLGVLLSLFSCLPEEQAVRSTASDNSSIESGTGSTDTSTEVETPTTLTESVNFFQMNSSKFLGTMSLFADYSDTFLVRGNNLISFLKSQTSLQANYCLITNFPTSSGANSKKVSLLSARVRSYYNSTLQTKEYFLQVEPNNETINQNDCLTASRLQFSKQN